MRQLVLVALPEGKAVEDLPMPHGSHYAATSVSIEALERGDVGLADSCGRSLMQRLLREVTTRPAWQTGVGARVMVEWCGEQFPGVVSHQVASDVWSVTPDPECEADRALLRYYACVGGWQLPASSIKDRCRHAWRPSADGSVCARCGETDR